MYFVIPLQSIFGNILNNRYEEIFICVFDARDEHDYTSG